MEKDVEALDSSLGEEISVCHVFRPLDAGAGAVVPEISQMECVQYLFLVWSKESKISLP